MAGLSGVAADYQPQAARHDWKPVLPLDAMRCHALHDDAPLDPIGMWIN
jgi:hypothetical protein